MHPPVHVGGVRDTTPTPVDEDGMSSCRRQPTDLFVLVNRDVAACALDSFDSQTRNTFADTPLFRRINSVLYRFQKVPFCMIKSPFGDTLTRGALHLYNITVRLSPTTVVLYCTNIFNLFKKILENIKSFQRSSFLFLKPVLTFF